MEPDGKKLEKKVVWQEGMVLDPQHMQQWDRYHHSTLHARIRALNGYDWGFTKIVLNERKLEDGIFSLAKCSGVLHDGLAFDLDGSELEALPLDEDFDQHQGALDIFLTVPLVRDNGINYGPGDDDPGQDTRFLVETAMMQDETTNGDPRRVEVAALNFRLVAGKPEPHLMSAKVAVVYRRGDLYELDDLFIPTCMNLAASPKLLGIAQDLHQHLIKRSEEEVPQRIFEQPELRPADIKRIGLAQTLHTYIPLLAHHCTAPESHPEALYTTLLALGGQLSVYGAIVGRHPNRFPRYDHLDLTSCFREMDRIIRERLQKDVQERLFADIEVIPKKDSKNQYRASYESERVPDNAQFFLEVVNIPDGARFTLPDKLLLAAPTRIKRVITARKPVLAIEHTKDLPRGYSWNSLADQYRLKKEGRDWDVVHGEKAFEIYVPSEFHGVRIKLIADWSL